MIISYQKQDHPTQMRCLRIARLHLISRVEHETQRHKHFISHYLKKKNNMYCVFWVWGDVPNLTVSQHVEFVYILFARSLCNMWHFLTLPLLPLLKGWNFPEALYVSMVLAAWSLCHIFVTLQNVCLMVNNGNWIETFQTVNWPHYSPCNPWNGP